MACGILEGMRKRRSPVVTALLLALAAAGLALLVAGAAAATYANSPANRAGNSFAAIGVVVGGGIAGLGVVICITAFVFLGRLGR